MNPNTDPTAAIIAMFPEPETRNMHIDNANVTNVTVIGNDFMLTLKGGQGYCMEGGQKFEFEFVDDIDLRFGWEPTTEKEIVKAEYATRTYLATLSRWQETRTPLTVVSGPTTPVYLIASPQEWLFIPRTDQ